MDAREPKTHRQVNVAAVGADTGGHAARRVLAVFTPGVNSFADRHRYLATMVVICAASLAMRAHALFISNVDLDEGVYIIMGQRWTLGGLPYVAVWDQHPPGLAALFALVQHVVPDPVFGARIAALFAVTMTALLIHRFCVRYLNQAAAGVIGALLYIVCISRWQGLAANTELFNNTCVTLAAYLLYGAARQSPARLSRPAIAAAVLGVGLQIKYVVFPESALLCLGYLIAAYHVTRDPRATAVAAGALMLAGLLPTGVAVGYFWAHSALQPFLAANVGSNIAYLNVVPAYSAIASSSASGLGPILGAILIIGYAAVRGIRWRWVRITALSPRRWILLWSVAAALDVALPLKFFNHYYLALYPPICMAGALALSALVARRRLGLAAGLVVLFATALPYWAMGVRRAANCAEADGPRAVADYLRKAGGSDLKVFVYDYQPVVYALARVRPPTPYVLWSELSIFTYSSHLDGAAEVRRAMDASPDFVVLRAGPPSEPGSVALDDVIRQRLGSYHVVREVTDGEDFSTVLIYGRSAPAD